MDFGFWIQDFGFRILDLGFWARIRITRHSLDFALYISWSRRLGSADYTGIMYVCIVYMVSQATNLHGKFVSITCSLLLLVRWMMNACLLVPILGQVGAMQVERAVQVQVVGGACTLPGAASWNHCLD